MNALQKTGPVDVEIEMRDRDGNVVRGRRMITLPAAAMRYSEIIRQFPNGVRITIVLSRY